MLKIIYLGDFGGAPQLRKTQPVRPNGLAREGILHLGTRVPECQVPGYLSETHLAAWQRGIWAILAAWKQDFDVGRVDVERDGGDPWQRGGDQPPPAAAQAMAQSEAAERRYARARDAVLSFQVRIPECTIVLPRSTHSSLTG